MSIIFGIAKTQGQVVERRDLLNLAQSTQRYAPDGTFVLAQGQVGMGFQPYYTHQRANSETLPLVDAHGNVLSFDGRLDNHAELGASLELRGCDAPDSGIVLRAFERWGEDCFSKFVGDWSLALWAHSERALYLARDHAGTRSLYFEHSNDRVLWSTYLETFFTDGRNIDLDEDFASLYFTCQPTRELTPYKGIRAVPPAHYLRFQDDAVAHKAHWEWRVKDSIVYDTDVQYEEQFFHLFRQSIERRTGPGAPILAQLSGGMDSSSIVCVSDYIRTSQDPSLGMLETISYFDNSEPNWNEFPFVTAVERSRGKVGFHLDASYSERAIEPGQTSDAVQLWPGADMSRANLDTRLHNALQGHNFRSVLSGLGGDEVLGGIPTPFPELADLLLNGKLLSLSKSSTEWCLANRVPFLHMFAKTLHFTCRLYCTGHSKRQTTPPWLASHLQHRSAGGLAEGNVWDRLHCRLPSKIANGEAWWSILETLPTRLLSSNERFEYRYPYLDRDLVDFLFRIPRRQIVEPGRRRSLMRRTLKNIVPNEILERRRKAYLIRGPINLIRRERDWIAAQFRNLLCAEMGLVDPSSLPAALDSIALGEDPKWWPYLMRLIAFELWLRSAPLNIPPPNVTTAATKIRFGSPSAGRHNSEI